MATRYLFHLAVKGEGYETLTAADAEMAMDLFVKSTPDLILNDTTMPLRNALDIPRIDGVGLIRWIRLGEQKRENKFSVPIIAICEDFPATWISVIEAGANEVLVKPIETRHLLRLIRRLINDADAGMTSEDSLVESQKPEPKLILPVIQTVATVNNQLLKLLLKAGRPKHKSLGEAIRALLEQPIDKRSGSPILAEAIANVILKKACKGDVRAAVFVRDTAEGRPAQKVQVEGSLQLRERERQVKFLVHTIKAIRHDLADETSLEEIWTVVERRELEVFGESVGHLRGDVLAGLTL